MLEFGQRFGVMEGKQAVITSLVFVLLELGSTINIIIVSVHLLHNVIALLVMSLYLA